MAPKPARRPRFARRYSEANIELLAAVDEAHERPSGPATRHILKCEFEVYGKVEFERLAKLSNGHLYNLRRSPRQRPAVALNPRVMKAYLLKESLDRLWSYTYEGSMLRYLRSWIDQLRWQRLKPMEKLADMLLNHLEGILNYCRTKVPLGMVEAVNGDIKALLRRGRGYPTSTTCY